MGLLDSILANPEANNALAAGLLSGNFGAGLLGMNQVMAGQRKEKMAQDEMALKKNLYDAQIANYQSESKARELKAIQDARQQALITGLLGDTGSGAGMKAPVSGDAFMPGAPPQQQQQRPSLMQLAEQLNIPPQAIQSDIAFNGGKGIAKMLYEKGAPDMQVTNGFAYNKNALGAGFMPSLSTSQDGKTSMIRIGADGLPVVSAPAGAVNTFAGYRNIDESAKANFDPQTVTGQDGRPVMTTRGKVVESVNGAGYSGGNRDAANAESIRMIRSEMEKPGVSPADKAALQREIGRLQMQSPGAVPGIPLQSKAEETAAVDTAKAGVVRDTSKLADTKRGSEMYANANRALELLQSGPTSSGIGALMDKGAGLFGQSTKGGDIASRLETLSGWMTSAVPRMEGPQSNIDVQNYAVMAGRVGDRTLPLSTRVEAAKEVIKLQEKYAHLNGLELNKGGASGDWSDSGKKSSMGSGGWSAKRIN